MRVYLDTNLLLHYRPPQEIDWCGLLDTSEVTFVLLPIVVRELDQHKNQHPKRKLRERARRVVKWLSETLESGQEAEIRPNVTLRCQVLEPDMDFSSLNLSRDVPDDWIVAGICADGSDDAAVLVTADLGLRMKARAHAIKVFELPDDAKLPDDLDDDTKQIRELQRELQRLRNAAPILRLSGADGESFISIVIRAPLELQPVEERLADVKRKHAPFPDGDEQPPPGSATHPLEELRRTMQPMLALRPEDIRAYNEALPAFFQEYEDFLTRQHEHHNMLRRSFHVALLLSNDGTAPANDVDVTLHFPDGMRIMDTADFPRKPQPPKPPSRPKSMAEQFAQTRDFFPGSLAATLQPSVLSISDVHSSGPIIKKTNSYTVEYSFRSIKHSCPETLEPLRGIFDSFDTAGPFTVEYRITAGNIPELLEGTLDVRVDTRAAEES